VLKKSASAPPAVPDKASVQGSLARVIASRGFAASPRLAAFLRFIVEETLEGREGQIKESTVAVLVFGRPADFDPRFDSVVRAQATLLRRRLREYYANTPADGVAIEIPRGSYVPVFRMQAAPAAETPPARPRSWKIPAVAAGLLLLGGLAAWWLVSSGRRATPSIAVLPFTDLDGVPENAHIGDGFVEDLTTDLAGEPGLRVVARTSAFQFRGKSEDVRKIGWQLNVLAVLEGSVRTDNGRVRVTAQLIDARTGYHLWSSGYEREMAGLRDVAEDIRRAVNHALGVEQAAAGARRASHTPPPEALDEYWRGRYIKSDWQRFDESLPHFERAAKIDPLFAEAWAALASVHANMEFQAMGPVDEEASKAKAAARRALDLDPMNAEAHAALGSLAYSYDYDWTASERSFRRALELNPNSAGVRRTYALALTSQARFEDAFAQLKLAQQSDPLSIMTSNNRSTTLFCARRYGEAMHEARRHLQMDPGYFPAFLIIGSCQAEAGQLSEAIASFQKVLDHYRAAEALGRLGNAQARAGRLAEARATLAELLEIQRASGVAAVALARTLVGMGDGAQAIDWLRKAAEAHLTDAAFMAVDPVFDPLHRDPDFRALCARRGLPVPSGK
jgi:serine/threonine-protein kinase